MGPTYKEPGSYFSKFKWPKNCPILDDRLCGEKARNGSTGPHISRDAPPTCGTESSEWVYRATYKPRCPANVRYRKLGMGLPGPHISRDAPPTCGTESPEWVYRATYKPRCPANVRYRKLGMGLPGPHISRDAPPTCGTESPEWVYRATYKPRCPANVRYRKLGMGLKMDKFKKKKPNTDGPEITWTRTMMDQNNYGLFGIIFFLWTYSGVSLIRVQGPDFFKTKKKICTPSKICVEKKKKFAPNTGWV